MSFFQRLLSRLVYADRILKNFSVVETRIGSLGGKVHLGVFPKDSSDVPNLNCSFPKGSQVLSQGYGYLIVTEGEYFKRFHSDFSENVDNLVTLYGAGEKTWLFVKPKYCVKKLENEFVDVESMMACLRENTALLTCCVQRVGDTVYLPYGWVHCVLTANNISGCSSLLSFGLRVPRFRYDSMWKIIAISLPLNGRRKRIQEEGAKFER